MFRRSKFTLQQASLLATRPERLSLSSPSRMMHFFTSPRVASSTKYATRTHLAHHKVESDEHSIVKTLGLGLFLRTAYENKYSLAGMLGFIGTSSLVSDYYSHPKNQQDCLEIKKIFYLLDTINRIKRFTNEELTKKELVVRDGLLYRADSNHPLDNDNLIYVLLKDGRVFVETQKRNVINHSSLGSHVDVMAAGEIKISKGKVYSLDEKSGHYRPYHRVQLLEHKLKHEGAIFHSDYECKFGPPEKTVPLVNLKF
jgi:hypothetical protein